ncbi:MAG: ABC transporter ATP-binding protein [Salinicola sp.]|uniref:ABC transporter ATP-binding protein n=1 Tax=uncultured Salinicola sp. TaxID=1193542 RepID=UPI000C96AF2C|nr:ABC transporter ATP-binding protein [uncultured Salinicola sp.]MAM57520.1 ABC transporter ATP-binding protein [Salinicola sp.]
MTQPLTIRLDNCAKTWPDGTRALAPLDLSIHAGETLALLGPSGCGKTTLLRMICGLERADVGGRIHFGDDDVTQVAPEARGVGVVFQGYALFPNMNVAQNVGYGLKIRGVDAASRRRRVAEMLELVELEALAERRIDQLSGGQRQRVALARAIAIEPRVLLLDEPLTALDARLRQQLRVDLAKLLKTLGITCVIVTHDQEEAMMLGDRVAVMSAGRLEQLGAPETLYRAPASPFVADFLGTLCRLEGGEVTSRHGVESLTFRPHEVELAAPGQGLPARIQARFFLGSHIRFELALADGQRFTALAAPDAVWQPDDAVSVIIEQARVA